MVVAKVAFRPESGLITPRQFGPMMRILPLRASASTCRSSSDAGRPDLLEAGRDDDGALHAGFAAFADDAGNRWRRA